MTAIIRQEYEVQCLRCDAVFSHPAQNGDPRTVCDDCIVAISDRQYRKYNVVSCASCGIEFEQDVRIGRPRTTCRECKPELTRRNEKKKRLSDESSLTIRIVISPDSDADNMSWIWRLEDGDELVCESSSFTSLTAALEDAKQFRVSVHRADITHDTGMR
jgi:hypothetical protein